MAAHGPKPTVAPGTDAERPTRGGSGPAASARRRLGASTVRGYLIELLATLWREQEGFSGKRPFGNSGWEYDLYAPLLKAGFIAGAFDEDGCVEQLDNAAGERLILAAIHALGGTA